MATSAVEQALVEVKAAIDVIEPLILGLTNIDAVSLLPGTEHIVQEATAQFERRLFLLKNTRDALIALVADGYPALPVLSIPDPSFQELQAVIRAILAVFGMFVDEASQLNLKASAPMPK